VGTFLRRSVEMLACLGQANAMAAAAKQMTISEGGWKLRFYF